MTLTITLAAELGQMQHILVASCVVWIVVCGCSLEGCAGHSDGREWRKSVMLVWPFSSSLQRFSVIFRACCQIFSLLRWFFRVIGPLIYTKGPASSLANDMFWSGEWQGYSDDQPISFHPGPVFLWPLLCILPYYLSASEFDFLMKWGRKSLSK